MLRKCFYTVVLVGFLIPAYAQKDSAMIKIEKSEEQWKAELSENQYCVLREKGTERAFTGRYYNFKGKGYYKCAACGLRLFDSDTKFQSGTGWPSFYNAHKKGNVEFRKDTSYGMVRTEVVCARCGGHLGHVFEDGPKPTGLRYCINSVAIEFVAEDEKTK